ncbi:sulfur oxidation c-type cytochrome SoxX [Ectothiorhodospira shaposhnikovii]|uniref:sulfur oxidation c-type cytochrome SoxX n=1 Tax=Ectothiorhodospira shaposhnikovii TaxID=1054 RepID=UPI001EE795DC|nr:sulfur oxidation c-type cytochrome SoxX [Ectothiorhodospira shaposhnikovii]MCG5513755.1 sulfur oxidation c-type cytochrome SoxX [Ectothiorhodospira shaposhnikovii]
MNKQNNIVGYALVTIGMVLASAALIVGCAQPRPDTQAERDFSRMSPEAYAEYLIFRSGSFNLDQATQEGTTAADRMTQDVLQRMCSEARNRPQPELAVRIVGAARDSIVYPEGGIQLGDWRQGAELARSGTGFRIGHNVDDHSQPVGGNCYACHQLDPDELGFGNLGPSLAAYGALRGDSEAVRKFVYDMIYNPHSFFPCTQMPRFGVNQFLTQESIAHIMAYLLDPESPVNSRHAR